MFCKICKDCFQKYYEGSYGSCRAYEIKISSGGEVHNLFVNEWGHLLKILELFYAYTVYTM